MVKDIVSFLLVSSASLTMAAHSAGAPLVKSNPPSEPLRLKVKTWFDKRASSPEAPPDTESVLTQSLPPVFKTS